MPAEFSAPLTAGKKKADRISSMFCPPPPQTNAVQRFQEYNYFIDFQTKSQYHVHN